MSYVKPAELITAMIDAGESKILMSTRDTLIRGFMGGATLTIAAAFAVTVSTNTGQPLIGALLFPVGFVLLYLLGYDLLTGVFTLAPLALFDRRPGITLGGIGRNWGLVFLGNFAGAFTVAVLMAIYFTYGFTTEPSAVGHAIGEIGHGRTLGYAEHGFGGMLTLFVRGMLCNWMVSTAVAMANLDIFEREGLNDNVRANSAAFRASLETLLDLPIVGDVRGDGYFFGIELVKDKSTKATFDADESERLLRGFLSRALFDAGLYCRADDRGDPVIQLAPPLTCGPAEFEEITDILRGVLSEASRML